MKIGGEDGQYESISYFQKQLQSGRRIRRIHRRIPTKPGIGTRILLKSESRKTREPLMLSNRFSEYKGMHTKKTIQCPEFRKKNPNNFTVDKDCRYRDWEGRPLYNIRDCLSGWHFVPRTHTGQTLFKYSSKNRFLLKTKPFLGIISIWCWKASAKSRIPSL